MAEAIYTLPEAPLAVDAPDTEGEYTHNPNHAEEAINNLIEFFRKPRHSEMMRIMGGQVQDAEDAAWQLFNAFDVSNATGAALDFIGAIVGERRDDRLDEGYRAAVRARVLVNLSNGRIEDMLAVIKALCPDSTVIDLEQFPAAIRFDVYDSFTGATPEVVARMLRQSKPAGVRLTFVAVDIDETLIWHSPAGADVANGWGAKWARSL